MVCEFEKIRKFMKTKTIAILIAYNAEKTLKEFYSNLPKQFFDEIVETILEAAKFHITKKYLGGDKGWPGDNNFVYLDNSKLKQLGWKPKYSFKQGIKKTVVYLLNNVQLLK